MYHCEKCGATTPDKCCRNEQPTPNGDPRCRNCNEEEAESERFYAALSWLGDRVSDGSGPVTFAMTENGDIGLLLFAADDDEDAKCDGTGDEVIDAIEAARQRHPEFEVPSAPQEPTPSAPQEGPCIIPLGGPSALHSELHEAGELDSHIAERHPEHESEASRPPSPPPADPALSAADEERCIYIDKHGVGCGYRKDETTAHVAYHDWCLTAECHPFLPEEFRSLLDELQRLSEDERESWKTVEALRATTNDQEAQIADLQRANEQLNKKVEVVQMHYSELERANFDLTHANEQLREDLGRLRALPIARDYVCGRGCNYVTTFPLTACPEHRSTDCLIDGEIYRLRRDTESFSVRDAATISKYMTQVESLSARVKELEGEKNEQRLACGHKPAYGYTSLCVLCDHQRLLQIIAELKMRPAINTDDLARILKEEFEPHLQDKDRLFFFWNEHAARVREKLTGKAAQEVERA